MLHSKGIRHQPIAAWSPEYNPCEAYIRRLAGMARVVMADASVTAKHAITAKDYPDAMVYSAHTMHYISGSSDRGGKSPFEIINGQVPDISHLLPFGIKGFGHIYKDDPKRKTNPLARGEGCTFVGYKDYFDKVYKCRQLLGLYLILFLEIQFYVPHKGCRLLLVQQ